VITVCSEDDRRYLGPGPNVHVIPNGFVRPDSEPVRRAMTAPLLGFIGTFEYAPNAGGVRWFVDHCWPLIRDRIPGARLRLIGRGSDGPEGPKGDGIEALGWVADPTVEIATWSAMVVPVRTSAGTRIKIAE